MQQLNRSAGIDLRRSTYSLLKELADKAQITAHIAVLEGTRAVYIEKIEVMASIRLRTEVGRTLHLHSTGIGKALLAFRPDDEIDRILAVLPLPALTPKTITDPAALKKELAKVRTQGYAVGSEENEIDTRRRCADLWPQWAHHRRRKPGRDNAADEAEGCATARRARETVRGEDVRAARLSPKPHIALLGVVHRLQIRRSLLLHLLVEAVAVRVDGDDKRPEVLNTEPPMRMVGPTRRF